MNITALLLLLMMSTFLPILLILSIDARPCLADDELLHNEDFTIPSAAATDGGNGYGFDDDVEDEYSNDNIIIDLDAMTDEELKEICTSRGFELIRENLNYNNDDDDDDEHTHQDYVDAARECLQVEAEM